MSIVVYYVLVLPLPLVLRYKILNAKAVTPTMTPEQAAKAILESIPSLEPEQYRMGHTKVG